MTAPPAPLPPAPRLRPAVASGVLLALASAVAFGLTTPWLGRAGRGVGPFTTAAALYLGAGLTATLLRALLAPVGPRLGRRQVPRLLGIAAVGAFLAPVAFAWGLQRTGQTTASLLLNFEAVVTTLLAAAVLREPIGARVRVAVLAMLVGGTLLALDQGGDPEWPLLGMGAVVLAATLWAFDNVLSRPLADFDPFSVVAVKGLLGAGVASLAALLAGESLPAPGASAALLACGATGYGISLRLYLAAQRTLGAGRTASIFATAPFLGAAAAWLLGDRDLGVGTALGAGAMAVGVVLHATERHAHEHVHEPVVHEHLHTHDDGHHTHTHIPPVVGAHSHAHLHERLAHAHEHVPDIHHDHHGPAA